MRKISVFTAGLLFAIGGVGASAHAALITYQAALNGASEVPANQTKGTGAAAVALNPATREVTWTVQYSGLTGKAMAAHIHCGAAAGANAPVAVPFKGDLATPIKGSATMTPSQVSELQGGKCYVNIHTAAHKGGEIRGQLMAP